VAKTPLNQQEPQRRSIYSKRILGIILSFVMIALTVHVLNLQHQNYKILVRSTDLALTAGDHATNNYRTYVGKYKETKIELDETTHKLEVVKNQLNQVTIELEMTKSMLLQTQGMLSEAQDENANLNEELQGLDRLRMTEKVKNIVELQARINSLKDRNSKISRQLADFKDQLHAFKAEFSNLDQGRSLIALFQNKIKLVKSRMRNLKQEAFLARVAAQKEKDRMAVLNGNNGFVVRNGLAQNPAGTNKSFAIDVKIVQ
jgi:chromosome segregation ATPase